VETFISSTDLEALLGTTVDPDSLIIAIALDSACQSVRTYLGQTVNYVADDVEVHSGSGRRKLRLRERPVRVVTEVKVDNTVIDPTTYNVRGAIITYTNTDAWTFGNDNIRVKYSHGYDIDEPSEFNVPADIRLVTLLAARRVYEAVGYFQSIGGGVLTGETIGDYSYTLSDSAATSVAEASALTEGEEYVLDRYRIELVGDTPTY